jgi:integrase
LILVTAGLSSPRDHALVSLLALNGLRVSEAIGANIEALGLERGHRTLTVVRKGGRMDEVHRPLFQFVRFAGETRCTNDYPFAVEHGCVTTTQPGATGDEQQALLKNLGVAVRGPRCSGIRECGTQVAVGE